MSSYFLVKKKINGKWYYYRQRTWKENSKTRTHSIYIGPVDRLMNILFPKPDNLGTPREAFNSYMNNSPAERAIIEKFFGISEESARAVEQSVQDHKAFLGKTAEEKTYYDYLVTEALHGTESQNDTTTDNTGTSDKGGDNAV